MLTVKPAQLNLYWEVIVIQYLSHTQPFPCSQLKHIVHVGSVWLVKYYDSNYFQCINC